MGIMDVLIEEMNKNHTDEQKAKGEKWERLHSEQYRIVDTENGRFRVSVKDTQEK